MAETHRRFNSFEDLKRVIVRHHWRFILPCFGVCFCVLIGSLFLPRQYEGQAIFERRNDLVMSEIVGRGAPQAYKRLKDALVEELSGLPAIDRLIDDLQLVPAPAPDATAADIREAELARQEMLYHLHRNIRVNLDISTNEVDRVRVTLVDDDPQRTRLIVNRLIENYISNSRRQIDGMLTQAQLFFRQQVDANRSQIDQLEHRKLMFEVANGELIPDESSRRQRLIPKAEERVLLVQQRLRSAEKKVESIRSELFALDDEKADIVMQRNPEITRLEEQLREYRDRLEEATVIAKMTDQHPTVIVLRRKIADIEQEINSLPREVVAHRIYGSDPKRVQLEMALIEARNERSALADELAVVQEQHERLLTRNTAEFPVRAEYRKLEQDIEEAQAQLKFWEDNLNRVNVAMAAEMGERGITMEFLKPCGRIQRPSSPNFMQVLFTAVALSLAVGVGWVLLAERTDQTFDGAAQASSALPAPVLGAVAEIISWRRALYQTVIWCVAYPAAIGVMTVVLSGAVYLSYISLKTPYLLEKQPVPMLGNVAGPSAPLTALSPQTGMEPGPVSLQ